ncbi:MAG: PIN domain-containing protein [Calditrichaceae bacterium]|nr:PIN domain-containing protein [Calditrichaceae bacterium]MBN2709714.1 PIN domain-containing protein [Calditrichaceae bacterium]RQV92541.1 MAG: PIN domain-containing protein [Calditrichota bacterium]
MNKLFIDSDILIDLLAKRPHYDEALGLLALIAENKAKAYTTPLVFANVDYIVTKFGNKQKSRKAIRTLRKNISVLTMNEKIFDEALESSFSDFEDALQYFSAMNQAVDFIITRNKKDYAAGKLKVLTAGEYLDIHYAEQRSKG